MVNSFDGDLCDDLQVLCGFGCRKERFFAKGIGNVAEQGAKSNPNGAKKGAKMTQGSFKDTPYGTGSTKKTKRSSSRMSLGTLFGSKSDKNAIETSFKNQTRNNTELYTKRLPKWSLN
jgi:hypothetical protein